MSLSALAVALVTPLLGSIADQTGRRKPWLAAFTALAIVSSALLWFAEPDVEFVLWALIFAGLGNFAFESGMVFYNSLFAGCGRKKPAWQSFWLGLGSGLCRGIGLPGDRSGRVRSDRHAVVWHRQGRRSAYSVNGSFSHGLVFNFFAASVCFYAGQIFNRRAQAGSDTDRARGLPEHDQKNYRI